jgi:hypothetical protein
MHDIESWWRSAVIYQIYPRSFADANGDGIGDLGGVRSHLDYLAGLGVDAVWFSPWYASPQADAGYDVSDYRAIDPVFGTLAEAEELIREAHARKIKIIVDVVPNHCSDAHPWFIEALQTGPGSTARELFWFRPGRGVNGELPPNGWPSIFGGPAWTRTTNPDGTPGEWYLHLFAAEQPDLNWDSPKVREEFDDVLRFWFDRGADGIRIDSAALLMKDHELADFDPSHPPFPHPYSDRDEVHEVYRSWRAIAATGADRRGVAARCRPVRRVPAAGRAAHRVQLRLPRLPLGRCVTPPGYRRDAGRTRTGDVGALQPRRTAARHPVRSRRHLVHALVPPARRAHRSLARATPSPGRAAAQPRPARLCLPVPG